MSDQGKSKPLSKHDESEIIVRVLKGDIEAYMLLVSSYKHIVYYKAQQILASASLPLEDAEDLALEAFVICFKNLGQLRQHAFFLPWVVRICTNLCLDHVERSRKTVSIHDAKYEQLPSPSVDLDLRIVVEDALAELDDLDYRIVILHYYFRLTVEETASMLGKSKDKVERRLTNIRTRLR